MNFPLSQRSSLTKVKAATSAGTGDTITTDVVDMLGWEGCLFFTSFPAITAGAVTTMKAQQGRQSNLSDAADLEGTSIAVADDDDGQTFALDIVRPRERYLRAAITRATQNASIGEVYALRYGPRTQPTTFNVADLVTAEVHQSPAEGTA